MKKIIKETYLRGSEGIPGETNDNEPKYLRDKEREQIAKNTQAGYPINSPMDIGRIMHEFMSTAQEVERKSRGKEEELSELAKTLILDNYGEILEGFELDMEIVPMGNIDFRDMNEAVTPQQEMEFKKRKIINTILQGEGINSKYIFNMQECTDGIKQIFGDAKGTQMVELFNRLSRLAQLKDWAIPPEEQARHMGSGNNGGFGGKVKVRWNKNNESLVLEKAKYGTIQVRAVDFPMCLHEAVKGIWEVIAATAIPEDKELAKLIKKHVDQLKEEPEEWKYGPLIAGDIRDFINENPEVDKHKNIREFVFGEMVKLPARDFLQLVKDILMKTSIARKKVDYMIKDIIEMLDDYNKEMIDHEHVNNTEEDEQDDSVMDEPSDEEETNTDSEKETQEEDPSTWAPSRLQDEIDSALDDENYNRVKYLTQFMKEGRHIYETELEIINENKNPHTQNNI